MSAPSVRPEAARAAAKREAAPVEVPRLLTLRQVAESLGVSYAQARALVVYGDLPSVALPCPGRADGATMRRRLVDVRDLAAFVEHWKVRT